MGRPEGSALTATEPGHNGEKAPTGALRGQKALALRSELCGMELIGIWRSTRSNVALSLKKVHHSLPSTDPRLRNPQRRFTEYWKVVHQNSS